MFNKLKMKIAARRVERQKARTNAAKKSRGSKKTKPAQNFWTRAWEIICAPFRAIKRFCVRAWDYIRKIDLIGMINLTLLVAIISLFSMLIIDLTTCNHKPIVIVADNAPAIVQKNAPVQQNDVIIRSVKPRNIAQPSLPLKKDTATNKFVSRPVSVVQTKKCNVVEKQTAKSGDTMYGDIIIDSRGAATILRDGGKIQGNLYLQNMRKYTLPCNLRVDGNVFLRDVNMLQFCGDFTITGNIYVSPRSSFGPIPRTARLGGQVIL